MPFDPSGNFTREYNWTDDRNNGIKVRSDRMDGEFDNFATAMNQVLLRNGVAALTGNLNMGTNSIIALGDGSVGTPAIRFNGSPTTGIYSPGLDRVAFTTSGTNRFEAHGTGATVNGVLTVSGVANIGGALNFPTSPGTVQVAGTAAVSITSSGDVTVGTALGAATENLDVQRAGAATASMQVRNATVAAYMYVNGVEAHIGSKTAHVLNFMTGGVSRATIGATGAAAFTGKLSASELNSARHVWVNTGFYLGLSGDNDTRCTIHSTTGADSYWRVNNITAVSINSAGAVTLVNALNVGSGMAVTGDASVSGGLFTGGAPSSVHYGARFRARSALNSAADFIDQSGSYAIAVRSNIAGVNLITSYFYGVGANLPLAFSGRDNANDFQMLTSGNAQFGNSVTVGQGLDIGTAADYSTFNARGATGTFVQNVIGGVGVSRWDTLVGGSRIGTLTATPFSLFSNNTDRVFISATGELYLAAKQAPTTDKAVGYLGIPQVGGAAKVADYTAVLEDAGQHILMDGAALTATIPANAAVAYPVGTTLTFVNGNASALSIAITTDTLTLAGTTTSGTRTLAQNGIATAIKKTATSWLISGPGLS